MRFNLKLKLVFILFGIGFSAYPQFTPDRVVVVQKAVSTDNGYGSYSDTYIDQIDFRTSFSSSIKVRGNGQEVIKQFKVKGIKVFNPEGELNYQYRYSKTGRIELEEFYDRSDRYGANKIVKTYSLEPNTINTYYFKNDVLLGVDSLERFHTLTDDYACGWTKSKSYKSGIHLNDQNQYYNTTYYNIPAASFDGEDKDFRGGLNYLDTLFKTDYNPTDILLYKEEGYCHYRGTDTNCCPKRYTNNLLPEAFFEEPHFYFEGMDCSGRGKGPDSKTYESIQNEEGFIVRVNLLTHNYEHVTPSPPIKKKKETVSGQEKKEPVNGEEKIEEEEELPELGSYYALNSSETVLAFTIEYEFYP